MAASSNYTLEILRREVSYKLLEVLTDAYRAVASGKIGGRV